MRATHHTATEFAKSAAILLGMYLLLWGVTATYGRASLGNSLERHGREINLTMCSREEATNTYPGRGWDCVYETYSPCPFLLVVYCNDRGRPCRGIFLWPSCHMIHSADLD